MASDTNIVDALMTPDDVGSTTSCIHQIVEARAAAAAGDTALLCNAQKLSYQELNERANQLAHHLRKAGVGPGVLVGLCLERTLDLVIAILGILKAGGAYVPIDPEYPKDRVALILEDSRAPVIVTQGALTMQLPIADAATVLIDRDATAIAQESTANVESGATPDDLAYVIYTSGSTGRPKGTLISHRNVVRLFSSTQRWFNFSAADTWTLFHSCAFDFSVWELWGALFRGGRLVIVPFEISRTPDAFYRLLCEQRVTVLNQTPTAFRQLMHAEAGATARGKLALRLVIFGGEALDFNSLSPWFERHGDQQPRLVNMYGITETTVHVTYRPISSADVGGSSVIGEPISDLQIYLKDDAGKAVLTGEVGEIYIGGAGVSQGYLNRPELTALKFIPDPSEPGSGKRLYRSGDLGRYLQNGDLEYLGRSDSQVKIRGFRIELGEIAAALNSHAAVRESAVLMRESVPGEKTLAAYVVSQPGEAASAAGLRRLLRERLPEYMIPSAFFFLDQLPLTVNGKLDSGALLTLAEASPEIVKELPDASGLERAIAAIWSDELRTTIGDLEQNFFDVGGNSANLVFVHKRLQALLEREFPITDLFAHSTIRALAVHFGVKNTTAAVSPATLRARRQREMLLAQRNARH